MVSHRSTCALSESPDSSAGEGFALLEAWSERGEAVPKKARAGETGAGRSMASAGESRLRALAEIRAQRGTL